MGMSSFNFKNLVYFHEIVHFGGFQKASLALKQSQPNLSRAIKTLEGDLNETLLLRSKNGLTLTAKGEEILLMAKKYVKATHEVSDSLTNAAPNFSIGASENLVLHVFPEVLKSLSASAQRKVTLFSGTSEQIESEVANLNLDVGLSFHAPHSPQMIRKIIGKVEFVVILPKQSSVKKLSELEALPFIGSRLKDYAKPYFALEALLKKGIKPQQSIATNSQEAQVRMVKSGLGFSVVPVFMMKGRESDFKIMRMGTFANLHLIRKLSFTGAKAEFYQAIQKAVAQAM
jgi:DNA-binding transcriptional LysR family regulator